MSTTSKPFPLDVEDAPAAAELESHDEPAEPPELESHDEPAEPPKRRRGRPPKTATAGEPAAPKRVRTRSSRRPDARRAELASRLEKGLGSLAELVQPRDAELADVLRQDAQAIGRCLASLGSRHALVGSVVAVLVVALEPIQAFGRLAALTARRWRARREARRAEWEAEAAANLDGGMDQRPPFTPAPWNNAAE